MTEAVYHSPEEDQHIPKTTPQGSDVLLAALASITRASKLRGLTFGNRIDTLLSDTGLSQRTMTFVYGKHADSMMNILCGNAVRVFGRAIFIDAANSFDPYLIIERCAPKKSEAAARKFIESITIFRAFTCYQLRRLVSKELEKEIAGSRDDDKKIRAVFVSGIGSVFNEQDNTKAETERLQLLMASSLRRVASDRRSSVLFVVASSNSRAEHFVAKSDTAIKLYEEKSKGGVKAILMKHHARQFAVIDL